MAFLVDVKLRGNKQLLQVRSKGRSYLIEENFEHIIPTWNIQHDVLLENLSAVARPAKNSRKIFEVLDGNLIRLNTRIELFPYARTEKDLDKFSEDDFEWIKKHGKFVAHAIGNPSMKYCLPHDFIVGSKNDPRNNVLRMRRWLLNMPFPIYPENGARSRLEELLREKKASIDLEVRGWKKKNDEIFLCPFITFDDNFGNYLLVRDDIGEDKIIVDSDFGQVKFNIINNVRDFGEELNKLFYAYDPLFTFIHNANYDLSKLKNLEKNFRPGLSLEESGKIPIMTGGSSTYIKRYSINRGYIIDTYPFSLNWLWLPNNKLFTAYDYMFGKNHEKEIESYDELEEWAEKSKTNPEYTRKCSVYAIKDAILGFKLGERSLEDILIMSYLFRENPDVIATTAKDELALKVHEMIQFKRTNTYGYRTSQAEEKLDEFSVNEEKVRLLELNESKRGLFNASLVYFTPFIEGLVQIISSDPIAMATYRKFQSANSIDKVILAEGLEAYLRKALFDLKVRLPVEEGEKFKSRLFDAPDTREDYTYGKIYGIKNGPYHYSRNITTLNNNVFERINDLQRFLQGKEIINFSDKFVLLNGDVDVSGLNSLAIKLGYGNSLSLERGRFSINLEGQFISQGLDLSSTRGDATFLQYEIKSEILTKILKNNSKTEVLDYLARRIADFENEPREKFAYLRESVLRDFLDYSDRAHTREKVQNLIYYGKRAGEIFNGGFIKGIKTLVVVPEFYNRRLEVDYERYKCRFFGPLNEGIRSFSEGTIGNVLYSIFCFERGALNYKKVACLSSIVEGKNIEKAREILLTEQTALF
ncbi:MAG: hypothetical protein AABW41_00140 [Nanoarchaeota archaeon]